MNTYSMIFSMYTHAMDEYLYDQYLTLIKNHANPTSFLEIGAGPSTLSKRLHQSFTHIDAFDNNQAMVDYANATNNHAHIHIFMHDMKNPLNKTYDTIAAPIDVFNHLEDFERFKQTFTLWMNHLNDEGIMIFDVLKCEYIKSLKGYKETFTTKEGEGLYWHVQPLQTPCTIKHTLKQNDVEASHIERSYPIDDIESLFESYEVIERIELEERIIYLIKK